jgi:hypothetical protein
MDVDTTNFNSHMESDTRQITITTPYGGGYKTNCNYNSHKEVDTRQTTTPIWRWVQDKLQLQLP